MFTRKIFSVFEKRIIYISERFCPLEQISKNFMETSENFVELYKKILEILQMSLRKIFGISKKI